MQATRGGHRVVSTSSALLLALCVCACGGGGDDAGRVAVLEIQSADAPEALLQDAAQEHGAPGENEPVRYRVQGGRPAAAQAAVAMLRAHGFSDVEIE